MKRSGRRGGKRKSSAVPRWNYRGIDRVFTLQNGRPGALRPIPDSLVGDQSTRLKLGNLISIVRFAIVKRDRRSGVTIEGNVETISCASAIAKRDGYLLRARDVGIKVDPNGHDCAPITPRVRPAREDIPFMKTRVNNAGRATGGWTRSDGYARMTDADHVGWACNATRT